MRISVSFDSSSLLSLQKTMIYDKKRAAFLQLYWQGIVSALSSQNPLAMTLQKRPKLFTNFFKERCFFDFPAGFESTTLHL